MADVLIRNIDKETLDRLKKQAERNKRSLQEELKELLEIHSGRQSERAIEMVREIQKKYKKSGTIFPDSAEEIRKDRDRR
ncbi:MAG: hypothetical protein GVY20_02580 [Bacteroidetes bacterium]|jgi:plasmid stability protein|nr:hypothetical protein [Bacteroidota bacterium]